MQRKKNAGMKSCLLLDTKETKESFFCSRNIAMFWNGEKTAHILFRQKFHLLPCVLMITQ